MPNIIYNPNEIEVNTTINEIGVTTQVNEIAVHTDPIIIAGGGTLPDDQYNKMYVQDAVPGSLKEGDQWYNPLTGRIETRADNDWQAVSLDGQNF